MMEPSPAAEPHLTDSLALLQAALVGRYTIERELGQGGMATVYLAHDVRHGRRVAVKVLRPELSSELGADRFVREIRLVARLNHPHILPLFDSGEADSLLYYVMPVVEGESLRARLRRVKQLPVHDAIQIAREVADALGYAHRHGIVHRDIKPENILLQDDHALVADFGIAKAVTLAATGTDAITRTGLTVGTPAYMSPEQAVGAETLDGRSDLYSLGCVLYEMLAGTPPFPGPTPQAVIAAHLAATPALLAEVRPDMPRPVVDVIARALAKDPDARFPAAAALLDALGSTQVAVAPRHAHPVRVAGLYGLVAALVLGLAYLLTSQLGLPNWVISGTVVLLLAGFPLVVATGFAERRGALARATGVPMAEGLSRLLTWQRTLAGGGLAFGALGAGAAIYMAMRLLGIGPLGTLVASGVLKNREPLILADFQNRASDSTLGPTLTAAFRVDLSESPTVRLMDGTAIADALLRMERRAATPLDPGLAREIAQRENVKAVVQGDIDPLGRGYVLSASVIAAADGHVLTAVRETAENDAALIGAVDRLSHKLRERIGESFKSIRAGPPLEQVTTASLDALRRFSEGFRAEQEGDWERAAAAYRDARAIDTGFATASWRLAVMLYDVRASDTAFAAAMAEAFRHRDRLPEIERDLAAGRYYEYYEEYYERGGDGVDKAISAYRAALERDPDNIIALNDLSRVLFAARRYQEAEIVAVRAMHLGQRIGPFVNAALAQMAQGRYDDAQVTIDGFARIAPHNPLFLAVSFTVAGSRGDYAAAERNVRQLRAEQRESAFWQAVSSTGLAWLDEVQGKLAHAARDLEDLMAINEQRGAASSYVIGAIRRGLLELRYRQRPLVALRIVEAALGRHPLSSIDILSRPYLALASFYAEAGRPEAARRLLAEYERLVPERNRRGDRADQMAATAAIAIAEGRVQDAIRAYRARNEQAGNPADGLFELAIAYEQAQQPDSALALYERTVNAPGTKAPAALFANEDPRVFAATLRRLGELYVASGDYARARDYYGRFLDQWKDADPELQPEVRDVRARLARLAHEH